MSSDSKQDAVKDDEYRTLKERFRRVLETHIEKEHGIVSAPDKLIEKLLTATSQWLEHDEESWGDCESVVSEALRDLRTNQMR